MLLALLLIPALPAEDTLQHDLQTGVKLYQEGRYDLAEPKFRSAVEQARSLDPADPRMARSWNNLAATLYARGRYEEAEQWYVKVLDWHREQGGKPTLEYAKILSNVASMYRVTARFEEAATLARKAVEIGERTATFRELAGFLFNLAEIERNRDNTPEAEAAARRALVEADRDGEDTLMAGHALQSLAMMNLTDGIELQRRASMIFEMRLPPDHPAQASAASNLGQLLLNRGEWDEAKPLLERALHLWRSSLGEAHPNAAVGWNNLARWHMARGEFALAEPMLRRAVEIWEGAFGTAHPDYAKGLYNLGSLFEAQGKARGAEQLYQRALAAAEPALGTGHAQSRQIREALAGLYEAESRETEAARIRGGIGFLPK
jgi:tetratricopeptide (TPR) repeat protein